MPQKMALRERVYDEIKHDIVTCKLAPGEPLSENQFLGRFDVSKTPIREALTTLIQDGLVDYTPNRGFMVTSVSVKDIQEIFEARAFFETELFRLAVKKISEAHIDELEAMTTLSMDAHNPEFAELFLESNLAYHLELAAAARNSRLLSYYENLMNEAQRLFYMDITQHSKDFPWAHGHDEVIGALRRRDEQAGVAAIIQALDNARRRILRAE